MSDFKLDFIAGKFGKSLDGLTDALEKEVKSAVNDVVQAAHASMVAHVQSMGVDPKNRSDYLRGLRVDRLNDSSWVISLEGEWANKLESGFSGYDMKEQLLKSKKTVKVGERAGEPWVRTSKDGSKYASVPFQHKPQQAGNSDLAAQMSKLMTKNVLGGKQSITKTFNDASGTPLSGKVASVKMADNPMLKGVTKYQQVSDKGQVSSVYMTYRVISEKSAGWQHPGFKGYKIFEEAERYLESELENIVKLLL